MRCPITTWLGTALVRQRGKRPWLHQACANAVVSSTLHVLRRLTREAWPAGGQAEQAEDLSSRYMATVTGTAHGHAAVLMSQIEEGMRAQGDEEDGAEQQEEDKDDAPEVYSLELQEGEDDEDDALEAYSSEQQEEEQEDPPGAASSEQQDMEEEDASEAYGTEQQLWSAEEEARGYAAQQEGSQKAVEPAGSAAYSSESNGHEPPSHATERELSEAEEVPESVTGLDDSGSSALHEQHSHGNGNGNGNGAAHSSTDQAANSSLAQTAAGAQ